jgi:antitoxin component YwqK of YwqJK toxin-antitoxin module
MRILIYVLFIFFLLSCSSSKTNSELFKTNTKVIYYQSGKIKSVGNTDDFTKNFRIGYWNEFYENGQLKESGNYNLETYKECCTSGICDGYYSYKIGEWLYYHENGKIKAKGTYRIGKKIKKTNCETKAEINFGYVTEYWFFYDKSGNETKPNSDDINEIEKSSYIDQFDMLK